MRHSRLALRRVALACLVVISLSSSYSLAQLAEPAPLAPLLEAEREAIELPAIEAKPASDTNSPQALTGRSARSWLVSGNKSEPTPEPDQGPGMGTSFAVVVLIGIAAASVFLARRRRKLSASASSSGQLSVLSSCRIGPKAHAVSLQADGRVYLLGVTEHNVCQIAALPSALDAPKRAEVPLAAPAATAAEKLLQSNTLQEEREEADDEERGELASSDHLLRFQALLRSSLGASEATRASAPSPPRDAASRLAASLRDVVTTEAPPKSLRRARRRRTDSHSAGRTQPAPSTAAPSVSYEGQVAGLRNLRSG